MGAHTFAVVSTDEDIKIAFNQMIAGEIAHKQSFEIVSSEPREIDEVIAEVNDFLVGLADEANEQGWDDYKFSKYDRKVAAAKLTDGWMFFGWEAE
jgi:hypothetical protein